MLEWPEHGSSDPLGSHLGYDAKMWAFYKDASTGDRSQLGIFSQGCIWRIENKYF